MYGKSQQKMQTSPLWRWGQWWWCLLVLLRATPAVTESSQPDPSCTFNPLCTCSGSLRNFRSVQCVNVPLASAPFFNGSLRLSHLLLDGNGLRVLDDGRFVNSGLERLRIVRNHLTSIPEAAFEGVTRSLKELDLSENRLCTFPRRALKLLKVLRRLNLNDNDIVKIVKDDFVGLNLSLEELTLAGNRLSHVEADSFAILHQLELLDLSGNLLAVPDSFRGEMPRLTVLLLSDNMLHDLPAAALLNKKALRTLDLSGNCMTRLDGGGGGTSDGKRPASSAPTLQLDNLILDDNQLAVLEPGALHPFAAVQRLSLSGNPLTTLANNTFVGVVVRELHLEGCQLASVAHRAFAGLETKLRQLNLANNKLTDADALSAALANLSALVNVNLTGNARMAWLRPAFLSNATAASIKYFRLDAGLPEGGAGMGISADGLHRMASNLRNLSLSRLASVTLRGSDFPSVGLHLDRLSLRGAGLQAVNADAFRSVTQVRHLVLDANRIGHLNDMAMIGLGDSLETLDMSGALSPSLTTLPVKFLRPLVALRRLTLSNNKLRVVPVDAFATMTRLRFLNLQDNDIAELPPGAISVQNNQNLHAVWLSFNQLRSLDALTFSSLQQLCYLYLDDNRISTVRSRAVSELNELEYLDLQSNQISVIEVRAFQDLPKLRTINLSHNRLDRFSFDVFDRVGASSSLSVDLSHNRLQNLSKTDTSSNGNGGTEAETAAIVTVEVLRLSHNNISAVESHYFRPLLSASLQQLHLDHNSLVRLDRSVTGDLLHLQLLRLDHNRIQHADPDALDDCLSLQALYLCHNQLDSLPADLLSATRNLRQLDLSDNLLDTLPENLFKHLRQLEHLDLSANQVTRFPSGTLWQVAATLRHLDLSRNKLFYLTNDALHAFDQLVTLDLSSNELKQLDDGIFVRLPRLRALGLAHNNWSVAGSPHTFSFDGAPPVLEELDLSGGGLTAIPPLDVPHLLRLNLSGNAITSVPATALRQMTELRHLDLSGNRLPEAPSDPWVYLPHLQFLSLSGNPIRRFINTSLLGLNHLNELHLDGLSLETVDTGFLGVVKNLRLLRTSPYTSVTSFDLATLLASSGALRTLNFHTSNASDTLTTPGSRKAKWPCKLRSVAVTGRRFRGFTSGSVLDQLRGRTLDVAIGNTSLTSLPPAVWSGMGGVRQLALEVSADGLTVLADPTSTRELVRLQASGDRWRCDCGVGWIEHWMRRRRQAVCGEDEGADAHRHCRGMVDDIRQVTCGGDRANRTLLDVLKRDLECGSVSGAPASRLVAHQVVRIPALLMLLLCAAIF